MTHDIKFTIPKTDLSNVDAEIEVRGNGKKIGVLHISKGTVDWKPAGRSSFYLVDWVKFGKIMKNNGKPVSSRE